MNLDSPRPCCVGTRANLGLKGDARAGRGREINRLLCSARPLAGPPDAPSPRVTAAPVSL